MFSVSPSPVAIQEKYDQQQPQHQPSKKAKVTNNSKTDKKAGETKTKVSTSQAPETSKMRTTCDNCKLSKVRGGSTNTVTVMLCTKTNLFASARFCC